MKVISLTSEEINRTAPIQGVLDLHNLEEFEGETESGIVLDFLEELGIDKLEED